jgi:MoaA/NifB/PqqE/SkfB family radical SAM enzyme
MCRFWSEESACADPNELSLGDLKKIALKVKEVYKDNKQELFFGITGGEAFLRKDIIDFFKFFYENKIAYDVITNFSLPDRERVEEFAGCKPVKLNVSLDGVGKTHNLVRGKDIFDKVLKNMKYFQRLQPDIPIRINSTINKRALNELEKMLYFAIENGFELNFQHLNFVTPKLLKQQKDFEKKFFGRSFFHEPTLYSLTKDEVAILKKKVKEIRRVAAENNFHVTFLPELDDDLENWYLNPGNSIIDAKCDPIRLRIKPNGELVHCERFSYGNLLKGDMAEMINSTEANKFKNTIKKNNMPFCSRCCLRFKGFRDSA